MLTSDADDDRAARVERLERRAWRELDEARRWANMAERARYRWYAGVDADDAQFWLTRLEDATAGLGGMQVRVERTIRRLRKLGAFDRAGAVRRELQHQRADAVAGLRTETMTGAFAIN